MAPLVLRFETQFVAMVFFSWDRPNSVRMTDVRLSPPGEARAMTTNDTRLLSGAGGERREGRGGNVN